MAGGTLVRRTKEEPGSQERAHGEPDLGQRGLPGVDAHGVQTLGEFPDSLKTVERIANENLGKDDYQYEVALVYRNLGDLYGWSVVRLT
jgi:hypothetical protein